MGIKHFFSWFRNRFSDCIYNLKKGETFRDIREEIVSDEEIEGGVEIDNLMIDMNGIFHNSAQKIYQYGNHKPKPRLLGSRAPPKGAGGLQKQLQVFQHICETIDSIIHIVKPKKRLILCVDGPAPLSKQSQQRQRRFLSVTREETSFDSNCITPGTKFMDFLSKYIDWYIRKSMSTESSPWANLEVIFSNEKAPGEGEHKLINYIRKYGNKE